MSLTHSHWQFWIDRGGTFTDIVARRPNGLITTHKLLSDNPNHYSDSALQGIRIAMGLADNEPLPGELIEAIKMGTTVGTNALLERKGERTILAITEGFRDCLRIGYQNRPDIFALKIVLPEMLYEGVIEISERCNANGETLVPLDKDKARTELQTAYDSGIRSVAIVLMHAWQSADHELEVAEIARSIGFSQISVSHQVSPLMKIVSRGDTTVVDAYLSPLLRRYVNQVATGLKTESQLFADQDGNNISPTTSPRNKEETGTTQLMFMQSNGGLVDAASFKGKDSILSGPAGGIVGAVTISAIAGFNKIVTFDMGGTSTDVAHYAGEYERNFETEVAGIRMRAPMMHIHTVAAGGGSILHFDGMRFRVGPDSAGANPGPACYRNGGPLSVTDANVMLGKLQPEFFPKVFGVNGNLSIDADTVRQKFSDLINKIHSNGRNLTTPEQVAEGYLAVAVENMANAIKRISIQRGYNVAEYTLCCFGAAGGQHACQVADNLGITRIFLHPYAGVLSAYGMGLADFRIIRQQAVEEPLCQGKIENIRRILDSLETSGKHEMAAQGISAENIHSIHLAHLRYHGTDTALTVEFTNHQTMIKAFETLHRRRFGFIYDNKDHIVEAISVEIIGTTNRIDETARQINSGSKNQPNTKVRMYSGGSFHETPVFLRKDLDPGSQIEGPAILVDPTSTTVIEPGWQGEITGFNHLVLTRATPLVRQSAIGTHADPVMLEIFNKLFMSIAEQMGDTLQNTAYSVNIKERLDFSCAVFDQQGELIANAPHIPVHLGSMGESVQALIESQAESMQPGDVYLLNSPYHGGTHLPDITIVTPVFDDQDQEILFYVASRGHHADIGGITPGSMPPSSQHIDQEGILSDGFKLIEAGCFREDALTAWLLGNRYPARNPSQNIADLHAQIAANEKGIRELRSMVSHYSLSTVQAYMQHVQENGAEAVRQTLMRLKDGRFSYQMDNGAQIRVAIRIDRISRTALIDFTGTSTQQITNLNAPAAVCKAAVLYVFRTLVQDDIPLNAGCLRPLEIVIPEGSMLNPIYPAAVVAGNVETSQYIVDALYGALGVLAASQGTMNNFTFGNSQWQYYETICGGAGAGADFDGSDAVHTHMTNSRITDPEVLEWRFPVVLEKFAIRQHTGGIGQHRGGNGVVRRVRFLEPMTAAILSSHRVEPPFGIKGGQSGALGSNWVEKKDATVIELAGCDQIEMDSGDVIIIETPGGGGFGSIES